MDYETISAEVVDLAKVGDLLVDDLFTSGFNDLHHIPQCVQGNRGIVMAYEAI
ncbi:MAG: hypothetical protein SOY37_03995 [Oscillospiraceae bacterium]|nr:hypothetical protein [Oscillospiraceae bacterium]